MQGFSFVCICMSVYAAGRTHNNISETESGCATLLNMNAAHPIYGIMLGYYHLLLYTHTNLRILHTGRHHRENLNDLLSQYTLDECP